MVRHRHAVHAHASVQRLAEHRHGSLVFGGRDGQPLDPDNLSHRRFPRALRQAGIARHVRLHDLRHTYASLLIAQGAHPKYIQVQMGHASIQTTLDRYGHLMPALHRAEASKLASTYIAGMSVIEELGSPFAAKTRSSLLVGREPGLKDGAQHCPLHPSGPDEHSTAGTRRVRITSQRRRPMASKPLAALAIVFALLAVPVVPSRAQAGGWHRSHTR